MKLDCHLLLSPGVGLSSRLTVVVERPDRRIGMGARLRAFAPRPSFRGSMAKAALRLVTERLRAACADVVERLDGSPRIRSVRPGQVTLGGARSVAVYILTTPPCSVTPIVHTASTADFPCASSTST